MNDPRFSNHETGGEGPTGPEEEKEAQDYLSKLANSILSKEKPRRPGASGVHQLPRDVQQQARSPLSPKTPLPRGGHDPRRAPVAQTSPQTPTEPRGWVRRVDMEDERGKYLPGTILVFEDGSVGVYKEFNPTKEYDIVYQLMETGRAVPQGIPLANYEVEPIGRVSPLCLEQIVTHNHWERDMIVFHLLKFKDVAYVPKIDAAGQEGRGSGTAALPKLGGESRVRESSAAAPLPKPAPTEEKPLNRGRRLTIDFGPGRRWDAIYWGKDELGHVVAHNTHDKWSLMHLDLARFKDSVQRGDVADEETLQKIEKDFANA